jgi:hypothetical protein
MTALGLTVEVTGNTLRTGSGAWVVTQACVATPLLPVYLAAVTLLPTSTLRRVLAALAAVPLFLLLGSARLLVLALPAAVVGSHTIAVHAFYQTLTAVLIVVWAARRSPNPGTTALRALTAGVAGAYLTGWALLVWLGPTIGSLIRTLHFGHGWQDVQGTLVLMPPFQIGLLVALWLALRRPVRDRRLAKSFAVLGLAQCLVIVVVGELAVHAGIELPVTGLRAVSLILPVAIVFWRDLRIGRLTPDSAVEAGPGTLASRG